MSSTSYKIAGMEKNAGVVIRQYLPQDRQAVRRISCETSFLEHPHQGIFNDDEILADALTLYFTDHEPQSCFVAESNGRVVGYLIGAQNVRMMHGWRRESAMITRLLAKAVWRGAIFSFRNWRFVGCFIASLLLGEFSTPDLSRKYPATLHINIEKAFRAKDTGSRLMQAYFDLLQKEGVRGVHMGTMSAGAGAFFEKHGFREIYKRKRTYLQSYIRNEIYYRVFTKDLA